jgi:iron complex transport system substrate-binding protein
MQNELSRRQIVGGTTAVLLGAGWRKVSAQNSATPAATPASPLPQELPSGGVQADGTWAFTDDLGVTVTSETVPTKVVAHVGMAAALFDFGFEVVGYYNPATDEDGNPLQIAGGLPLDRLTHVGDFDEIDIELLISLGAELFIGQNYSVETGGMWPFSDDVLAQIHQAVPVLSFAYGDGVTVVRNIESLENLAAALGADVDTPEMAADRDAFLTSSEALRAALADKPDLTALFLAGSNTGFWIDSSGGAATRYYRELGMDIIPAPDTGEVSWEELAAFPADIVFVDDRVPTWWSPEQLASEVPVWEHHPAVAAGQVAPWRAQFISSYRGYAPVIAEVVNYVREADDSVV